MPSEQELNRYYENTYWEQCGGKSYVSNGRDFVHFQILKEYVPTLFEKPGTVINFGAGHGGVSHLLWLWGFNVINVEPSSMPQLYQERWVTYTTIDQVPEQCADLVYGSHSLEHVQNIDLFKGQVNRVLKRPGHLFWEVPNGKDPKNGGITGRVAIPHTYYFFSEFFADWFDAVLLNDEYEQSHDQGVIDNWRHFQKPEGPVLRALGRMI